MYFLKIENLENRKIRKRITCIFHKSTLLQIGIYLSSPNIVSITCGLGGVCIRNPQPFRDIKLPLQMLVCRKVMENLDIEKVGFSHRYRVIFFISIHKLLSI